jgi:glycosyltransferase involved in cell wall biosynthesis
MKDQISIIVPVYNVAPYLERCLQSLAQQDYSTLEIILIDDGSTDGSEKICDEWAAKDERIKVLHQQNHGQAHARNRGLDMAQGEWISFVDADDYLATHAIALL